MKKIAILLAIIGLIAACAHRSQTTQGGVATESETVTGQPTYQFNTNF